jgi:hypothetical protein
MKSVTCSENTAGFQDTRMPDKRPHTCTVFGKLKNMMTLALKKQQQIFFKQDLTF